MRPFAGKANDRSVFTNLSAFLSVAEQLVIKHGEEEETVVEHGERIIADGGFFGPGPVLCPYKYDVYIREKTKGTTPEEKQDIATTILTYNEELTLNRSAVENSVHLIKSRAQILQGQYSRSRECQTQLFYAAARLVNRIRRLRFDKQITMNKMNGIM